MSQPRLPTLVIALALAVLGGTAVDAVLNLGDTFLGDICDPLDVDVLEFDAIAGTNARFRVIPAGGSMLEARLILVNRTDDSVLADVVPTNPSGIADTLLVTLPDSGKYELRVSGENASTGMYRLQTTGRIPLESTNFFDTQTVLSGGQLEVPFEALNGYRFSATINPAPSSQALPANPVVEGPGGPVPLTGFVFLKPDQIIIRKLPLGITSIQSFVLKADNVGGEGAFKTHVFLEPTIPKQTIEDDDDCN